MKIDDKKYCITSIKKTIMRMRKLLFIFVAVLMVACTMTEQDKAERLVKEYMERNANDPSSVEYVEFGKLQPDSVFYFSETDEYKEMMDSSEKMLDDMELLRMQEKYSEGAALADSGVRLMDRIEAKTNSFKPYQRGMKMRLEYRAKNGVGALVKSTAMVRFDDELTKITSFEDLN